MHFTRCILYEHMKYNWKWKHFPSCNYISKFATENTYQNIYCHIMLLGRIHLKGNGRSLSDSVTSSFYNGMEKKIYD